MSVAVLFRDEANQDVHEARDWYETQQPGLGGKFVESLELVVTLIGTHPLACAVVYRGLRRALLPGFPYAVFYRVFPDCVRVIACLHQHRGPKALQKRTSEPQDG